MIAQRSRTSMHPMEGELLACLYQHRLATTAQLHQMVAPEQSTAWVRKLCRRLGPDGRGLMDFVRPRGESNGEGPKASYAAKGVTRVQVWYLTERGTQLAESGGVTEPRRRQLTFDLAAGKLQQHTLAVNEVGVAFMSAARERGHECGHDHWRHEWPLLWPDTGRRLPVADAWLRYRMDGERAERFVEVDRSWTSVDALAEKLGRYAEVYAEEARWRAVYPSWPEPLVVFAGDTEERLRQRMAAVAGLYSARQPTTMPLSYVTLPALQAQGPWARVFLRYDAVHWWTDWLGQA